MDPPTDSLCAIHAIKREPFFLENSNKLRDVKTATIQAARRKKQQFKLRDARKKRITLEKLQFPNSANEAKTVLKIWLKSRIGDFVWIGYIRRLQSGNIAGENIERGIIHDNMRGDSG